LSTHGMAAVLCRPCCQVVHHLTGMGLPAVASSSCSFCKPASVQAMLPGSTSPAASGACLSAF
jgi:hypothetical protein